MSFIPKEFFAARTGEGMEARLQKNEGFQQQMKSLHRASKMFTRDSVKSDECWEAFNSLEYEWGKYNIWYGEESYRLGFEDGIQLASEKKFRLSGSVLSYQDMVHLIYIYDAIKKLNKLLLGGWEVKRQDGGILKELDRICDVVGHGVCAEVRLCGKDKLYECLEEILDDSGKTPEERAKLLTGLDRK